ISEIFVYCRHIIGHRLGGVSIMVTESRKGNPEFPPEYSVQVQQTHMDCSFSDALWVFNCSPSVRIPGRGEVSRSTVRYVRNSTVVLRFRSRSRIKQANS